LEEGKEKEEEEGDVGNIYSRASAAKETIANDSRHSVTYTGLRAIQKVEMVKVTAIKIHYDHVMDIHRRKRYPGVGARTWPV